MAEHPVLFYGVSDAHGASPTSRRSVPSEGPDLAHLGALLPGTEIRRDAARGGDPAREEPDDRGARMGRSRKRPLRPDWEMSKDEIMLGALRAKFGQHEDLKRLMLGTGERKMSSNTKYDRYWGDGGDGSGAQPPGRAADAAPCGIPGLIPPSPAGNTCCIRSRLQV